MKKSSIWIVGAIVIVILIILLGGSGKKAKVTLRVPVEGSLIFVDANQEDQTNGVNEDVTLSLEPGEHTIVVANELYWPWTETIVVAEGDDISLHAFNLPQSASGFILTEEDPEYPTILSEFNDYELPTEQDKITSSDGTVALWVGTNKRQVLVEWLGEEEDRPEYFCNERGCFDTTSVFIGVSEIRSISFLAQRSDVMVLAMEQGIFAVEIEPTEVQNLQLLDSGTTPSHIFYNSNVYSLDGNLLKLLNI